MGNKVTGIAYSKSESTKTITKLSTKLDINLTMTSTMAAKWHSIKYYLNKNHIDKIAGIEPTTADKYRGDLEGLFIEVMGININYVYPHCIVNGYDSPSCYEGAKLYFKLLDTSVLAKYYKLFLQTE